MELLDETQNAYFDYEYHTPEEMQAKLDFLGSRFSTAPPLKIVDLGGGNGVFSDRLLDALPHAEVTLVDVSNYLLEKNRAHPRKTLMRGDIFDSPELLGHGQFDVVCINWVLHHLVDATYHGSLALQRHLLAIATQLLRPEGVVLVAENMFDGWGGTDAPSRIIYTLTRVRKPVATPMLRRFFNTAGVGVCFHSETAWGRLFERAGYVEATGRFYGKYWHNSVLKRTGLLMRSMRHAHFFLVPAST